MTRLLLWWLLAAGVCSLALRFFFPGYLDPFAPFHLDHYHYVGMHVEGYGMARYFLYYPRPVAHVLIDLCGRLGIRGLLAPLYVLAFLNAALVAWYAQRVSGARVAVWCFLLFSALAYANPEFYWNLKQDPFSVFALTFLLCIFHSWQSYVETGRKAYVAAVLMVALPFSFTKESYFVTLALFFAIQILVSQRRRAALALLLATAALMGVGLWRAAQVWTLFHAPATAADPYYTSLAPRSVWHGFLKIGKYLAVPATGAGVLTILVAAWRSSRRVFVVCAAAVLLGAAALLPNATLPNHLESQYAFLGAYFFLAPFLLLDHLIPRLRVRRLGAAFAGLALLAMALVEYRRPVREVAGWLREQEQIARRMLPELQRMRAQTKEDDHSLVRGATMFYNPFLSPPFILSAFGPQRRWTVIVPDEIPESDRFTTRVIHASNAANSMPYDHLFIFAPDGRLIGP